MRRSSGGAVCYHTFVSLLLLICGGLLLSLGIWQLVTNFGGLSLLTFTSRNFYSVVFSRSGVVCTALGGVLLLASVIALLVFVARAVRYAFLPLGIVSLIVLAFVAVIAWVIAVTYESSALQDRLRLAWRATSDRSICAIEAARRCRAFETSCAFERCATACALSPFTRTCYVPLTNLLFKVHLPIGILAGIASLLLLVDLFVVFAL